MKRNETESFEASGWETSAEVIDNVFVESIVGWLSPTFVVTLIEYVYSVFGVSPLSITDRFFP
ncbi:hypothetical protein BLGI_4700 [Brevibacillus laterosporus GI-9]|nr:hypothetical protein BLGI_4700 [Brevibacillus laterosporus GI-9]